MFNDVKSLLPAHAPQPSCQSCFMSHLKQHVGKTFKKQGVQFPKEHEFIKKHGDHEYWWNDLIKTSTKVAHNRPNILIWNKATKLCAVVVISCQADVNIIKKTKEKLDNYVALLRNLQMLHQDCKFEKIPIIIGALGYTLKELNKSQPGKIKL